MQSEVGKGDLNQFGGFDAGDFFRLLNYFPDFYIGQFKIFF